MPILTDGHLLLSVSLRKGSGRVRSTYGRRIPILVSYAGIIVFSILSAVSTNLAEMLLCRLLVGFSFGCSVALGMLARCLRDVHCSGGYFPPQLHLRERGADEEVSLEDKGWTLPLTKGLAEKNKAPEERCATMLCYGDRRVAQPGYGAKNAAEGIM